MAATTAAAHRDERERRLQLYREAFPLSADELLAQYEGTDPRLCASLLDPLVRPMISGVNALTEAERDGLLSQGRLVMPLSESSPEFQRHLGRWVRGEWGRPDVLLPQPDPDSLPRFANPEDRWSNSGLTYQWHDSALQLHLDIPDVGRFFTDVILLPSETPYESRMRLAELGYRQSTADYMQAAEREALEWQSSRNGATVRAVLPAPPPLGEVDDPRLQEQMVVDFAGGDDLARVLSNIAESCDMPVVAQFLPREAYTAPRGWQPGAKVKLGELLTEIREERQGLWWWELQGDYLIAKDEQYTLAEASRLPPGLVDELRQLVGRERAVALEELASTVAGLTELQVQQVKRELELLRDLPLQSMRPYGILDPRQRLELARGALLPVSDLEPHQQAALLRAARRTHPWFSLDDLATATIRIERRRVVTGGEGISLILDYHLADSRGDRDVLFTLPAVITLAGTPGVGPGARPPAL